MQNYVIFTDTACDISPALLKEWQVECVDLRFRRDGETDEYTQAQMPTPDFYREMREGTVFKTSAANGDDFEAAAVAPAANGRNVWECWVAGVDPAASHSDFKTVLERENDGWTVKPSPDLGAPRTYAVEGSSQIGETADWGAVTEDSRFFRVKVSLPE